MYVYILASKPQGTLYIGVTSDLVKRVWEHKNKVVDGFTKKYNVSDLVYFEIFEQPIDAIAREKELKRFQRAWKIKLIEECNLAWRDLYDEICQ